MKRAKTSRTGKTFKVKDEEQKREITRPGTRKRVKKSPEPRGTGVRIKPDLHKRPYGLLESVGIYADGLTPGQAWAAWDAYRRDVAATKREAKSAPAKKQNPKAAKGKRFFRKFSKFQKMFLFSVRFQAILADFQ